MNSHPRRFHPFYFLLALSLAGILVLLFATVWGIGVSPDSTVYIGAARHLLRGEGLKALSGRSMELEPLAHYPPLYPLVLALAGGEPLHAARWLNAFIFGINILLAGVAVGSYTRWSLRATALASLLVLAAPDMLQIHSMAWTEPLFILFSLAGLLLLAAYLERERRVLLLASSVAVALGFLTRYAGVVMVATGVCGILFWGGKNYLRRFLDAGLFAFVACVPLALWMMRNSGAARGATDREFVFHPVGFHQLSSALSTISTWLLLGKVRTGVRATVFLVEIACLIVLCILIRRKNFARDAGEMKMKETLARMAALPLLLAIFIIFYAGFFIITASFIDFDTVFDERALAPVHVFGIILSICLAHRLLRSGEAGHLLYLLSFVLCIAFAGSYVVRGANWVRQKRGDGQGYTSRAWAESATIERIRSLPAATPIFTNGYDAVYFLTGRRAMFLPEKIVHGTGRDNALYASELAHMREQLLDQNGVLVYFDGFTERAYLPSEDELKRDLNLRPVSRQTDGTVYQASR